MRSYVVSAVLLAVLVARRPRRRRALFKSDNVPEVGTLPEAVGRHRRALQPRRPTRCTSRARRAWASTTSARRRRPQRLSRLPLPHFENEDVDVGHIGGRDYVIITNDPSVQRRRVIYVIDVTDPRAPSLASARRPRCPGSTASPTRRARATATSPTASPAAATCGRPASTEGLTVFDLADPTQAAVRRRLQGARRRLHPRRPHRRLRDRVGHRRGRHVRLRHDDDRRPAGADAALPLGPGVTNTGNSGPSIDPAAANDSPLDFLHHNSMRVNRTTMAITEEDYLRPGCNGQGSLQTWKITTSATPTARSSSCCSTCGRPSSTSCANRDRAAQRGGPPTTVNCSAHWFDVSGGLHRPGLVRPGRPLPRRLGPARHQPGRLLRRPRASSGPRTSRRPTRAARSSTRSTSAGGIDVIKIDRAQAKGRLKAPARKGGDDSVKLTPHPTFGFSCPLLRS